MKRTSTDETIRRTSIVDTVTERLRREILSGEIEPGGRIRVGELEIDVLFASAPYAGAVADSAATN